MIYYSYSDLLKSGYHISKQMFKYKCLSGELKYELLNWCRNNPEKVMYIIPESELPKLEKYKKGGELVFNPKSQPDYYTNLWAEEDRKAFSLEL